MGPDYRIFLISPFWRLKFRVGFWIFRKSWAPLGFNCPSSTRPTRVSLLLTLATPLLCWNTRFFIAPETVNIDKCCRTFLCTHIHFLFYANLVRNAVCACTARASVHTAVAACNAYSTACYKRLWTDNRSIFKRLSESELLSEKQTNTCKCPLHYLVLNETSLTSWVVTAK